MMIFRNKIVFLLLFSVIIISCNYFEKIDWENLERVKYLDIYKIKKISFYNKKLLVKQLFNQKEFSEFMATVKPLVLIRSNHPQYIKEWDVVIDLIDGDSEKLTLMLKTDDFNFLYVNCLGKKWFGGAGTSKSEELYKWMLANNLLWPERGHH